MLQGEGLRQHAAHRQSDEMRMLDAQRRQEAVGIGNEIVEAVTSAIQPRAWGAAAAVTACVEHQNPITGGEFSDLTTPHGRRAGERVSEYNPAPFAVVNGSVRFEIDINVTVVMNHVVLTRSGFPVRLGWLFAQAFGDRLPFGNILGGLLQELLRSFAERNEACRRRDQLLDRG